MTGELSGSAEILLALLARRPLPRPLPALPGCRATGLAMSCPGLHCPGCSGGQSLGVLAGVVVVAWIADEMVQWVAERIWWIGGTLAVCFALATAASMWLEAWADRRGARFAARHGIVSRADVILTDRGRSIDPSVDRLALGFRDLHIHLDGMPDAAQVSIIRQALNGRTDQP